MIYMWMNAMIQFITLQTQKHTYSRIHQKKGGGRQAATHSFYALPVKTKT